MKTAEEIIIKIQELSQEERRKVIDYFESDGEREFLEENYSPEDMALLEQDEEEYRQGINTSGPFYGKDAIAHLDNL